MGLFKGDPLPNKNSVEYEGYTIEVTFLGLFQEFTWATAQAGDKKATITITNPDGRKVEIGSEMYPINLFGRKTYDRFCIALSDAGGGRKVDNATAGELFDRLTKPFISR